MPGNKSESHIYVFCTPAVFAFVLGGDKKKQGF